MGAKENTPLKALIVEIFKNKNVPIYKTAIHKILYKLYTQLPEDNSVRDQLPFYWYNYGPFSEVVANELDDLKRLGILEEIVVSTESSMLRLVKSVECPKDTDFQDASLHLEAISNAVDLDNFRPFKEEIYRKDAPLPFMPLFKLDFFDLLEKHIDDAKLDIHSIKILEKVLYKCEAYLPSNSMFTEFNANFSSFVTGSTRIFDYMRDEGDTGLLNQLCFCKTDETWKTFTKGIRILYHHKYYADNLPRWGAIYDKSLKIYIRDIEVYNEDILSEIPRDKLLIPAINDKPRGISSSISKEYLYC